MTAEVVVHEQQGLTLSPDQAEFTDMQVSILKQIGVKDATRGDLAVFHHVCQRTGLDPFARQIYMLARWTKDGIKQTIQTGIDGYRLVARRAADRAGESLEYEDNQWCGLDGQWVDVWLSDMPPHAAKVTVLRDGKRFPAVVKWTEYVQTTKNGDPTSMWARMPANQLAKCAEAAALRKAFPQDLSGIYTDDEMAQSERPTQQAPQSGRDRIRAIVVPQTEEAGDEPDPTPSVDEPASSEPDALPIGDAPELIRPQQMRKMQAEFKAAGIEDSGDRHRYAESVIGHPIENSSHLTVAEASAVIESLVTDNTPQEVTA